MGSKEHEGKEKSLPNDSCSSNIFILYALEFYSLCSSSIRQNGFYSKE